eukprot:5740450-Pyramimonas_sp.AAC.2
MMIDEWHGSSIGQGFRQTMGATVRTAARSLPALSKTLEDVCRDFAITGDGAVAVLPLEMLTSGLVDYVPLLGVFQRR